jgi:hypothetical protein
MRDPLFHFAPLPAGHPLLDAMLCAACDQPFQVGDLTTLAPLGPGTDARRAAREGRPYNAVSLPLHWACATGEEE